jgi:predicted dehydrogenase
MSNQKPIRVGLVGVGNWATYGHIPALQLLPAYEIAAVCSRSIDKATETATRFGIEHAFSRVEDLVALPDVDLIVVLPPTPQHVSIVKAAIDAGKDVYCEWPLTTSTADSEELLRLAEAAGVRHCVGLQRTLGVSSQQLSELIEQRYIGDVRSVRMHVSMASFGPTRSASLDWTIPAENFSHVLSIYGGHFMDMLFHSFGMPETLSAVVESQFPALTLASTGQQYPNETPDQVMIMGRLTGGALFQIHIEGGKQNVAGLHIEVAGTEGDLKVLNEKAFVTKHHDVIEVAVGDKGAWTCLLPPASALPMPCSGLDVSVQDLAQLYAAFASDRTTGTTTVRTFADAVRLHRLIDAINESSRSGKAVSQHAGGEVTYA